MLSEDCSKKTPSHNIKQSGQKSSPFSLLPVSLQRPAEYAACTPPPFAREPDGSAPCCHPRKERPSFSTMISNIFFACFFAQLILRKEKHANAVLSLPPKLDSQTFRHLLKNLCGIWVRIPRRLPSSLRILPCPMPRSPQSSERLLTVWRLFFPLIFTQVRYRSLSCSNSGRKRRPWNCQPASNHTFPPPRLPFGPHVPAPAHRKSPQKAFLPLLCACRFNIQHFFFICK